MSTYIARRLLLAIPTILIVTMLTTVSIRLIPGDAIDILVGQMDLSGKENREELRQKLAEQLDEAGLTRGSDGVRLKIDMMIDNESQLELELAEISISFWEDIGVIVTLDLVDPPVRQSRLFEKQFEFFAGNVAGRPNALNDFRLGHQWNRANLTDSTFIEMWEDVLTATDSQEQADLIKAASSKWLELAPAVQVPAGFGGDYWQPWVHNHGGERALAFVDYSTHWAYVWLDRDLRAERTGFKD